MLIQLVDEFTPSLQAAQLEIEINMPKMCIYSAMRIILQERFKILLKMQSLIVILIQLLLFPQYTKQTR